MTRLGLALAAGLALAGCADDGSVPIYVGDNLLTTVGGTGAAPAAGGEGATARPQGLSVGSLFADTTPIYVGGRRINCPDGAAEC